MKSKIFNFLIYGFGQSINILGPLLVVPHIITTCGFEGLGKVGIAFSLSLLLSCFIDYSSALIGTKEVSINRNQPENLKEIILNFLGSKLIITAISILILLISVYSIPFLAEDPKLYLCIIPLLIAQLFNCNWILQGLENFKLIALMNILSKGSYLILVFSLISKADDYIWINFYLGISSLIFYLGVVFYIFNQFKIKIFELNLKLSFQILKRDFSICISEFCLSIYQFFPIILVGYVLGNTSAGIFKIIEQIISVFRTYIFMFFNFSYPTVCFDFEESQKKGLKTWLIYHSLNSILLVFGAAFIYLIRDYVFQFFKIEIEYLSEINYYIKFALLIPLMIGISQALRQLMFALNLIKPYTYIIYFSTILNVALMFIFSHKLGILGVIYSMIIIEIIVVLLYTYFSKERIKQTLLQ